MVDLSPLNLTISHWDQSPRKALQMHLPSCSTCSYSCRGKITFSTTALVRQWSSLIHSHTSSPNLALRLQWILPSIMLTCPLSKRKPPQMAFEADIEMNALADIIISGWSHDIKEVPHPLCPYWHTMNHLLLKMDLCSV